MMAWGSTVRYSYRYNQLLMLTGSSPSRGQAASFSTSFLEVYHNQNPDTTLACIPSKLVNLPALSIFKVC